MLFHTFEFFLLLSVSIIAYFAFPKARVYIIALANIVFYSASGIGYLVLFVAVAFITYFCSLKLSKTNKKIFFYIALIANVFNLLFFKYTGFVLSNIETMLNIRFPWQDEFLSLIILPVGISFYTFQMIAYLVDVRKKELKPCHSFVKFWVFISFFGQLIAGPIMRGKEFLPQINNLESLKVKPTNIKYGLYFIVMGLIKKIIFADMLARQVNLYYSDVASITPLDAWFATYLFAFQIYFDFSSYSEMAVGLGYLFGLKLNLNFKSPYISSNATEFWKRWHITLSTWIRDYIYFPIGGAKKGALRRYINIIIAMTISGLWHGAAWTFIIWGAYHGVLSVAHKLYDKFLKRFGFEFTRSKIYKAISIFVFFHIVCLGWVLFRAGSFNDALILFNKMLSIGSVFDSRLLFYKLGLVLMLYGFHVLEYFLRKNEIKSGYYWKKYVPSFARAFCYIIIFILLALFTQGEENTFIYFQF